MSRVERSQRIYECACLDGDDCYCRATVPEDGDLCTQCSNGEHLRWAHVEDAIKRGKEAVRIKQERR